MADELAEGGLIELVSNHVILNERYLPPDGLDDSSHDEWFTKLVNDRCNILTGPISVVFMSRFHCRIRVQSTPKPLSRLSRDPGA